jgi:hypothetical protein
LGQGRVPIKATGDFLQLIRLSRAINRRSEEVRSRLGSNRKRSEPEQRCVLLFDESNGNALHPFDHDALGFEGLTESGVVRNVSKALRDTTEKKNAIPGRKRQSEIPENIAGNFGKKAER